MRAFIVLIFLFITHTVFAACPVADKFARENNMDKALPIYIDCALYQNDDETQNYLAGIYEKGQGNVAPNLNRALLFYHLSAENGNASSMVSLSNILRRLDETDSGRKALLTYLKKIRLQGTTGTFNGQLLHPYALLMLAAEKPEVKWFYTTAKKSDPRAAKLLKEYQMDDIKKKEIIRQATQWKQRKMMDIAKEVLSATEFRDFYQTLYPQIGMPNAFKRSQAVNQLKEKIESKQK